MNEAVLQEVEEKVHELVPVSYEEQLILTTKQVAEIFNVEITNIKSNFSRNKKRFVEEKHYFKLEGEDLKSFKDTVAESGPVKSNVNSLIFNIFFI